MSLLIALKTYQAGKGQKGSLTWSPVPTVVDALEAAFYRSFTYVEPSGKNLLLGLDVSGSMGAEMSNTGITCVMASACMAMVTARTEQHYAVMGFAGGFVDLGIRASDSLEQAMKKAYKANFGTTDCSLPMVYAKERGLDVDGFVVYTDSETFAGKIHPHQALQQYRKWCGKPEAKLIVVGMTSNGFTIADPSDRGMLDVVGFDASTPAVISNFVSGKI